MPGTVQKAHDKVIRDFGRQWTTYTDNDGYYGSPDLFREILGPLLPVEAFAGKRVAEIGSGSGRIVTMLCAAGPAEVTAIEPSAAFDILQRNVAHFGAQVVCARTTGDKMPAGPFDFVLSIGVLHHIPDPAPAVRAAYEALKPGGKMVIWLYGREGNGAYLAFVLPLRHLTRRAPHAVNAALAWLLDIPLRGYIAACRRFDLPLKQYMLGLLDKITPDKRRLIIYDQINPEWAKYYRRDEAEHLLSDAGFVDVTLYHRDGYSWTVIGTKSAIDRDSGTREARAVSQ